MSKSQDGVAVMVPSTVSTDPVYSQGFSTDNAGGWEGAGWGDLVDSNIHDTCIKTISHLNRYWVQLCL